jgi:hypothetical protein
LSFKRPGLFRSRLKHNVPTGDEGSYPGQTKRLEDLTQRLHFDGSATANIYRSKKSDKSKHSETLIFKAAV